ncbi:hypothetical protein BJV74DRAFT_884660 [Russula compacta]|nr:hypothetical protein BJV74DRAFT_884660 [Russula compacta]
MSHPSTPPNSQGPSTGTRASQRYKRMTQDACEKFVGPMPIVEFLLEFIPETSRARPTNKIDFILPSVSRNEDQFIGAIEKSGLCPNLKFINTTSRRDGPFPLKPDISIYSDYPSDGSASQRFLDWKTVDLWVENKNGSDDIFRSLTKMESEDEIDGDLESHIKWTKSSYNICGQLLSYASALHRSQFRVFSFAIVLFGDKGRLLRWDRSGVVYSESFDWTKEPDTLFEFLWRLNFLSDVDRGYDTTVTSVGDDEAEAALSKLRTYKGLENVQRSDLHKILVHDDHATDGELRCYVTPSAIWHTDSLFGRSTFGYIAYDVATSNLVYLKDFWRTDLPGIQKEGDVYRELHEAEVPNIPVLGRAGDVPLSLVYANTAPVVSQRTKTQDYVKGSGYGHEWCPGRPQVNPFVHYRLVLETLGQPLSTFNSTRQLCEVIRDAIVAHTAAYEKAHILHRDVSAANILITESGSGMLIDWDLSKKVIKDEDEKPRVHSRTGTWQFISITRLRDPLTGPHEVSDDLESFFWVLLYLVTPCGDIIEELRTLFRDLYCHVPLDASISTRAQLSIAAKRERDSQVKDARKKLSSSEWILDMMNRHLGSRWDVTDDGSLIKTELRLYPSAERNCRKRKAPNDQDEGRRTWNAWRKGRLPPSVSVSSGKLPSLMGHRCGTNFSAPSSVALHASGGSLPSRGSKLCSGSRLA